MMSTDINKFKANLQQYNQAHLIHFWDKLNGEERDLLLGDLAEINFEEVLNYFKRATSSINSPDTFDGRMTPIPSHLCESISKTSKEHISSYEEEGLKQISESTVGVLLLAGGQGTRLGSTDPKGMYDVGLPSHKSLYQIQAERITKLVKLASARTGKEGRIPWFIMTSEFTLDQTEKFFKKHKFFGLNTNDVIMFEQGLMPCFTLDGKIILDKKHRVSRSPDGNGGLYRALRDLKKLEEMEKRGIKYLYVHGVDNILVRNADPVFIGYCVNKGSDCGAKVVEKSYPSEAVGVISIVDGKFQVVEYSEISQKTAEMRNPDGKLTYNAGNICNHFFTLDFLKKIAFKHENELTLHVAKKKIPFVDACGNTVKPDKPNGIKLEKFVFDVFPFSENFVAWQVNRDEEFSALKNADGAENETPTTARNDLFKLHAKYIKNAGGTVDNSGPNVICEISPLLSYAGEGLESTVQGKKFKSPVLLSSTEELVSLQVC